jgi:glutamate-1-semialdehyde 2,1-aminomutase
MAAARVTLEQILTPESYLEAERLGQRMYDESIAALAEHGVAAYGSVHGFRGAVVVHDTPATNYREFLEIDTAISHLRYLVQHNRGVFMSPWAKCEGWTLSTMHSDDDASLFVENMRVCAELVAGLGDRHSDLFAAGSVT